MQSRKRLHYNQISITGSFSSTPSTLQEAVRIASNRKIDLSKLISHIYSLSRDNRRYCGEISHFFPHKTSQSPTILECLFREIVRKTIFLLAEILNSLKHPTLDRDTRWHHYPVLYNCDILLQNFRENCTLSLFAGSKNILLLQSQLLFVQQYYLVRMTSVSLFYIDSRHMTRYFAPVLLFVLSVLLLLFTTFYSTWCW